MQPSLLVRGKQGAEVSPLALFQRLARSDRSLHAPNTIQTQLEDTRLRPVSFRPESLFDSIATQAPILFSDFPAPLRRDDLAAPDALIGALRASRGQDTYPVRFGSSDAKRNLTIREIMQRWQVPGAVLGITDLPVRDKDLSDLFDVDFLAPWNLMPGAAPELQRLEMLTAVFSTAGKLTDSHSDDMAVCNHCFHGRKLWLAWETYEGLDAGLEDVERVSVHTKARFDLQAFLSLPSAHWFLVEPGQTIFLPGKFTHRVYTLENYIGVGSFYVALANLLHTAGRWTARGSLWDEPGSPPMADRLLADGLAALARLKNAPAPVQAQYGWAALPASVAHFDHWTAHAGVTVSQDLARAADWMRGPDTTA